MSRIRVKGSRRIVKAEETNTTTSISQEIKLQTTYKKEVKDAKKKISDQRKKLLYEQEAKKRSRIQEIKNILLAPSSNDYEKETAQSLLDNESKSEFKNVDWQTVTLNITARFFLAYLLILVLRLTHSILESLTVIQALLIGAVFLIFAGLMTYKLGIFKSFFKTNPFAAKYDYWLFSAPLAVIANYLPISAHPTGWAQKWPSIYFDFSFLISIAILLVFPFLLFTRNNKIMSTRLADIELGNLQSDSPITSNLDDLFNRRHLAERVAEVISKKGRDSLTIGLYGEWGSGKSSMFKMIHELTPDEILSFEFKPWYFGVDSHDIIRKFLLQFLENIKDEHGYNSKLDKAMREYALALSNLSLRPAGMVWSVQSLFNKLIPDDTTISMTKLKDIITTELTLMNKPVVVMIDDIDRLDATEIQMVFKLVRLVADFPNVTYILALDEKVVVDALNRNLSDSSTSKSTDGNTARKYLEKFIQIPIYLPHPEPTAIADMCWSTLQDIAKRNDVVLPTVVEGDFRSDMDELKITPRNVKRFLNTVEVFLPLIKHEVNIIDLLYLLLLKTLYPEVFDLIRTEEKYFLHGSPETSKPDRVKELLHNDHDKPIRDVVEKRLFRQLTVAATERRKEQWLDEMRICTPEYFDLYFQYSVPTRKLSLNRLREFLHQLESTTTLQEQEQIYQVLVDESAWSMMEIHTSLRSLSGEMKPKVLVSLHNLLVKRYERAYESNNGETESIWLLLSKLIDPITKKQMLNHTIYKTEDLQKRNLGLMLRIMEALFLKSPEFKQLLCERYSYTEYDFSMVYNQDDAKMIFREWSQYADLVTIRGALGPWVATREDLNRLIPLVIDIHGLKQDERVLALYVNVLRFFPYEIIEKYRQEYSSNPGSFESLDSCKLLFDSTDYMYQELTITFERHIKISKANNNKPQSTYFIPSVLHLVNEWISLDQSPYGIRLQQLLDQLE